jgi:hypothetical protein
MTGQIDSVTDRLQAAISGLSPRDRVLVAGMVGAVLLFGVWLGLSSLGKAVRRVEGNLGATQAAQEQVNGLLSRYAELQGDVAGLDTRLAAGKDFQPSSWIEEVGNGMGISGNLKNITERGTEDTSFFHARKLDLTIDDIDLGQLVELNYKFEKAPQAIRVTELTAKAEVKDRSKLDIRLQLAVLQPPEGATP